MKRLLFYLIVLFPLLSYAQVTKERRVYYLDCTFSMIKPNKVWDIVRTNLKEAINNVNDETTDLLVIPFWDKNKVLTPLRQDATTDGKKILCNSIDKLVCPVKSYTILNIPLDDFYKNRVSDDRITYMFLMTDGVDENQHEKDLYGDEKAFDHNLATWEKRFAGKPVYGFYVMVHPTANDSNIASIIERQEHLWKVQSADVNINMVRLPDATVFNVRNEKYVDIPLFGNLSGLTFKAQFEEDTYYHISKTETMGDKLRVWIETAGGFNKATLPAEVECNMSVCMTGAGPYTFLVTDKVKIVCKNEKEYSLKVTVQ